MHLARFVRPPIRCWKRGRRLRIASRAFTNLAPFIPGVVPNQRPRTLKPPLFHPLPRPGGVPTNGQVGAGLRPRLAPDESLYTRALAALVEARLEDNPRFLQSPQLRDQDDRGFSLLHHAAAFGNASKVLRYTLMPRGAPQFGLLRASTTVCGVSVFAEHVGILAQKLKLAVGGDARGFPDVARYGFAF